jgi:hypothetical protein
MCEEGALECRRDCMLHLASTPRQLSVYSTCNTRIHLNKLVTARPLLPVHARKASEVDFNLNPGLVLSRTSTAALLLLWAGNGANDLGVAHFEVAGSIGCCLRAHLSLEASQLVPSAAVQTQMRQYVGGSIERHASYCGLFRLVCLALQQQSNGVPVNLLCSAARRDKFRGGACFTSKKWGQFTVQRRACNNSTAI